MKLIEWAFLFLCSIVVITLGVIHSIHGTDPHHWGFILANALDLAQGKVLFKETYVQYGLGQPFLYQFLSQFFPINFSTIGMITSVVYALHLGLIYAISRKIGGPLLAAFIYGVTFLIHTYSISPWPNYYAGVCLSSAILLLLQDQRVRLSSILAGLFLFLAFFFRSTYLLSIVATTLVYLAVVLYAPNLRSKKVFTSLLTFYVGILIFAFILAFHGDLQLWYEQSIGSGTSVYAVGFHELLKSLRKAFWPVGGYLPDHIVNTSFVIFFNTTAYFLIRSVIRKIQPERTEYVFIALLGLAGLSQVVLSYEYFRLQNDCMPIFIITAVMMKDKLSKPKWRVGLALYLFLLILRFPNGSILFPLYDGTLDSYQETSIPIFKFHRFQPQVKSYYEGLAKLLCQDDRKIINLTIDSTIPYLCSTPKNDLLLPLYNERFFKNQQLDYQNKWVVTDQLSKLDLASFDLIGEVIRPGSIRFFDASRVAVYLQRTPSPH